MALVKVCQEVAVKVLSESLTGATGSTFKLSHIAVNSYRPQFPSMWASPWGTRTAGFLRMKDPCRKLQCERALHKGMGASGGDYWGHLGGWLPEKLRNLL